ncbi:MAG: integrase/recombinase XerD [Methanosarcinales archaeon]|nr:integrase/recombinase XerD [Methanosarcinales archaeon]
MGLYNTTKKLERAHERALRVLPEEDHNVFLELELALHSEGLSQLRILKYVDTLIALSKLGFRLSGDKRNVLETLRAIELSKYADSTKHDLRQLMKKMLRLIGRSEDAEIIKSKCPKDKAPQQLLTEEDVVKLIEAARNPRDRALIAVLWETGARISEVGNMQVGDVHPDDYGAILMLGRGENAKTGFRRVRVVQSASYLVRWIASHPDPKPEAPLWVSLGLKNYGKQMAYWTIGAALKKIARRAGLNFRIHPHLFRHSRATYFSKHLTEAQMCHYLGWVQGSNMPARYIHLSGRDVDESILELSGVKVKKQREQKNPICPRCEAVIGIADRFCPRCGLPLSLETAQKLDVIRGKLKTGLPLLLKEIEQDERLKELFMRELETWALELDKGAPVGI